MEICFLSLGLVVDVPEGVLAEVSAALAVLAANGKSPAFTMYIIMQ